MISVLDSPTLVALSQDPVRALNLSEDGRTLVLADINRQVAIWRDDNKLQTWDLESEDERFSPIDIVRAVALLPGGNQLAVAVGRDLKLMDIESGICVWSHSQPNSYGFLAVCPQAVDVSPGGAMVASFDDGYVATWMPDGTPVAQWQMTDMPLTVQCLADGNGFFGAGRFRLAKHSLEGKETAFFNVRERVFAAHYHERLDRVAIRTLEEVELWEFGAMEPYASFHTAAGAPTLVGCEKRNEWAYADQSGVWAVTANGERTLISQEFGSLVLCMRYAQDGSQLFAGLSDGRVVAWKLGSSAALAEIAPLPERHQTALNPTTPHSAVLAMRLGALIGLFAGMAIMSPLIQAYVLAGQNLTAWERFVTNVWLSFCLGTPFLFVGMAGGWVWSRFSERKLKR